MAPSNAAHDHRHRVVLMPLPYQGHINPMLRLAAALHARGLAVTILHTETHEPADRRSLPASYGLVTIPDGIAPELAASGDIASFVFALNKNCDAPFREYLAGALRGAEEGEGGVACVVADVDWFAPLAAARELGVPALALMTTSAARFRVYLAFQRLCDKGYLPVQESKLEVPVADHAPFLVRDLSRVMSTAHHLVYSDLLAHMMAGVRRSSGLVLNTLAAIEGTDIEKVRDEVAMLVFPVGPLHMLSPSMETSIWPQDRGCLDWLDTQAPGSVLFVSFGSLVTIDKLEFLEIAQGLADSERPFLWVVRPRLVRGCDSGELMWTPETSSKGRMVSWAPQQEVLKHPAVGAFLTHCGWNSTLESISKGVPMVCMPLSGDQFGTARYVCDVWKVGVRVRIGVGMEGKPMRVEIKKAIDMVMDRNEGREVRERASDFRDMVRRCTSKGGSCDQALQRLVDFIGSDK